MLQSSAMEIEVKLFGNEARLAGSRGVVVQVEGDDVRCDVVLDAVGEACEALKGQLEGCRLAVNHEFVDGDALIVAGDEVALIGAVSGG